MPDSAERIRLRREHAAERIGDRIAREFLGYAWPEGVPPTRERVARWNREWNAMSERERVGPRQTVGTETAREFCDRVPRELGLVDFNSIEARRHLEKRLIERDAAVAAAERERIMSHAPRCRQCHARTEPERWCYAIPTCFACLPPPPPIEPLVIDSKP